MNEPDNYEWFLITLKTMGVGIGVYLVLRFLCKKGIVRTERFNKRRLLLAEEYRAYSTDELLELLQSLEKKRLCNIVAALSAARSRMKDERIRLCVEQLQNSKHPIVKENAKFMIKDYIEGNIDIKPAEDTGEN